MFKRPGVLSVVFVVLALGACGRTSLLPKPDGGLPRGDAARVDGAVLFPDSLLATKPDVSPDRLIRTPDTSLDSPPLPRDVSPNLRVDASPDSARDNVNRPDLADVALDRPREIGDTVPDRRADGAAPDIALESRTHDLRVSDTGGEVPPRGLSVLAGTLAGPGGLDGIGPSAQFYFPGGVALDGAGNLFIADSGNNAIRKMVVATAEVSTVAGLIGEYGSADGVGASARFYSPQGLALDASGNLYIADSANHTIRKMVLASGQVTTMAGTAGQSGHEDGRGSAARFDSPTGLALDGAGNLYVSDLNNTIRRIVLATGEVSTARSTCRAAGSPRWWEVLTARAAPRMAPARRRACPIPARWPTTARGRSMSPT